MGLFHHFVSEYRESFRTEQTSEIFRKKNCRRRSSWGSGEDLVDVSWGFRRVSRATETSCQWSIQEEYQVCRAYHFKRQRLLQIHENQRPTAREADREGYANGWWIICYFPLAIWCLRVETTEVFRDRPSAELVWGGRTSLRRCLTRQKKVCFQVARMLEMCRVQQLAQRKAMLKNYDTYYGDYDSNEVERLILSNDYNYVTLESRTFRRSLFFEKNFSVQRWNNLEEIFFRCLDTRGDAKQKAADLDAHRGHVLYYYNYWMLLFFWFIWQKHVICLGCTGTLVKVVRATCRYWKNIWRSLQQFT